MKSRGEDGGSWRVGGITRTRDGVCFTANQECSTILREVNSDIRQSCRAVGELVAQVVDIYIGTWGVVGGRHCEASMSCR